MIKFKRLFRLKIFNVMYVRLYDFVTLKMILVFYSSFYNFLINYVKNWLKVIVKNK